MKLTVFHALAQMSEALGRVIFWSLVLMGVLIALFVVTIKIRRWSNQTTQDTAGQGFTLSSLREMHRQGQISDEEFERAKARIVAGARRSILERPDSKTGDPPPSAGGLR